MKQKTKLTISIIMITFTMILLSLLFNYVYFNQEVKVEESKPLQKDEYCSYQNYLIPISDECLENWRGLNCSCDDIIKEFLEEYGEELKGEIN